VGERQEPELVREMETKGPAGGVGVAGRVTDTKCDVDELFDSRNGEVDMGAVTDMKIVAGDEFNNRNADALSCAKCEREFTKDETIWRARISPGGYLNRAGWRVVAVCQQCRPGYLNYLPEKPCVCCGRPVINEAWGKSWYRKHTYCSERCAKEHSRIVQKSVRVQRRQQRQYVCRVCEQPFRPTRTDSTHCSNACRQRDYRRRGGKLEPQGSAGKLGPEGPAGTRVLK